MSASRRELRCKWRLELKGFRCVLGFHDKVLVAGGAAEIASVGSFLCA